MESFTDFPKLISSNISHFLSWSWSSGRVPLIPRRSSPMWSKINLHPICFFASGKRPGELVWLGKSKLIGAIKLEYLEGSVRCATSSSYDSKWGCYQQPDTLQNPLNVVITDLANHVIFPLQKYIRNKGLWYYLPATDPLYSKELVFTNYLDPFYLQAYSRLRIWYGEDLRDWYNKDNHGRVCVNVYAHMMGWTSIRWTKIISHDHISILYCWILSV